MSSKTESKSKSKSKTRHLENAGGIDEQEYTFTPDIEQKPDNIKQVITENNVAELRETPSETTPVTKSLKNKIIDRLRGPILNSLANSPVYYLARDIIGKQLGLEGTTYTEQDLTPEQLQVLDEQVRERVKQSGIDKSLAESPGDTIYTGLNLPSIYPKLYGRNYGNSGEGIVRRLITPVGQAETIIGDAVAKVYNNGYEIIDTYDFNHNQGQYKGNNSPYAVVRRSMNFLGHTDLDKDKGKQKFSIKRNVNHWGNDRH